MTEMHARELFPMWSSAEPLTEEQMLRSHKREVKIDRFKKRYGIAIAAIFAWGLSMILGCCITGTIVRKTTEREVTERVTAEMLGNMHRFMEEQEQQRIAAGFVTGEESREAAITSAVDAVAPVISKLSTDAQKLTEASCMLARVINPAYPGSFEEVAAMPSQWMFFDGSDLTCTAHDKALAERIVRPYMESGIVPNGLTSSMVYGAWSPNDFILRDSYENKAGMTTWRFSE